MTLDELEKADLREGDYLLLRARYKTHTHVRGEPIVTFEVALGETTPASGFIVDKRELRTTGCHFRGVLRRLVGLQDWVEYQDEGRTCRGRVVWLDEDVGTAMVRRVDPPLGGLRDIAAAITALTRVGAPAHLSKIDMKALLSRGEAEDYRRREREQSRKDADRKPPTEKAS